MGKCRLALAAGVAMVSGAAWAESDTQRHLRRACAVYDLHTTMSIEEHGPSISGTGVADAFAAVLGARTACIAGRYFEGVSTYRSVSLKPQATTTASAASR